MPTIKEIYMSKEMSLRCEYQRYIGKIYGPTFTPLKVVLEAMAQFENERKKQMKAALEAVK